MECILISACLSGEDCAYDGKSRACGFLSHLSTKFKLIPVCPEVEGGLTVPRERHEIKGCSGEEVLKGSGAVLSESGVDRTQNFIDGARKAFRIARSMGVRIAIMKENSPSCGVNSIYSGEFNGEKISGNGVAAALLTENNIKVFSEHDERNIMRVCSLSC